MSHNVIDFNRPERDEESVERFSSSRSGVPLDIQDSIKRIHAVWSLVDDCDSDLKP